MGTVWNFKIIFVFLNDIALWFTGKKIKRITAEKINKQKTVFNLLQSNSNFPDMYVLLNLYSSDPPVSL